MQILALSRRVLVSCGFCSRSDGKNLWGLIGQFLIIAFFLINLILLLSSHVALARYELRTGNISECLNAILQASAVTSAIFSYTSITFQRKKMRSFLNGLQSIFDEYENSTSAKLYLDINAFCEKCMKWTLILQDGIYIIPSLCALLLASVFYYYRDGHVEAASLKLPMKTRTPFEKDTYPGFWASCFVNYVCGVILLTVTAIAAITFLTMGIFFNTFRVHFESMFKYINDLSDKHRRADCTVYAIRVKSHLIEAVNYHKTVCDLFEVANEVMSGTVFSQLVLGIVFISTVNFQVELQLKTMDPNVYLTLLLSLPLSTGCVFMFCAVGAHTTNNYSRFASISYESHWYKFPVHLQKYMLLIISAGQQPRIFQGLGITSLDLMSFTQVMKTVASYYLLFKSLAA